MRQLVATEVTGRNRVANKAVTYALRSLDDSILKLERVVLRPEKARNGPAPKWEIAPKG